MVIGVPSFRHAPAGRRQGIRVHGRLAHGTEEVGEEVRDQPAHDGEQECGGQPEQQDAVGGFQRAE
jgi:hypothetical protein